MFQGFCLGLEAQSCPNDLSIPELVDVELPHVDRHAARLPATLPVDGFDDGIARFDQFLDLGIELVERSGPQLPRLPDRVDSPDNGGLIGCVGEVAEFGVGRKELKDSIEVASI